MSWIHGRDFARALDHILGDTTLVWAINLAAPTPLPYREFARELRRAAGAWLGLPAPRPLLELGAFLLRTETELVLKSRRVVPGRLLASGFTFQFPEWSVAVRDLVARWRAAQR